MVWYAWASIGWIGVEMIYVVLQIGKPRKPLSPSGALNALIVWGVFAATIVSLARG